MRHHPCLHKSGDTLNNAPGSQTYTGTTPLASRITLAPCPRILDLPWHLRLPLTSLKYTSASKTSHCFHGVSLPLEHFSSSETPLFLQGITLPLGHISASWVHLGLQGALFLLWRISTSWAHLGLQGASFLSWRISATRVPRTLKTSKHIP